jgi:hypothetical protein
VEIALSQKTRLAMTVDSNIKVQKGGGKEKRPTSVNVD